MAVDPVRPVPLGDLKLWDRNPRLITTERFDSLKKSLAADPSMMEARPLIALRDGRVIAGNMRLRAALELNWDAIPVVYVDLTEDEAITWALRDNNPYGEYDDQALSELLFELQQSDVDLDLTGFSADDITRIFDGAPPPEVPPDGPDDRGTDLALANVSIGDPEAAVVKGEMWQLGDHVLVVDDLYDGWPRWIQFLTEGSLLVPYPTPTLPLTVRANTNRLVMIQPDPWLAGHVIDKWAAVRGAKTVSKIEAP